MIFWRLIYEAYGSCSKAYKHEIVFLLQKTKTTPRNNYEEMFKFQTILSLHGIAELSNEFRRYSHSFDSDLKADKSFSFKQQVGTLSEAFESSLVEGLLLASDDIQHSDSDIDENRKFNVYNESPYSEIKKCF